MISGFICSCRGFLCQGSNAWDSQEELEDTDDEDKDKSVRKRKLLVDQF